MEQSQLNRLKETKERLDAISPTFCVAKWKQVTMHLESGLTHSCHHPKAHIVPLDELEESPSALHNTKYKKQMRKQMLDGDIVPECEYCNNVERNSGEGEGLGIYSDRIYKSREAWAEKYIAEIVSNPPDYDVFPSYFEVSFSSACNCSCIYCSSTFSSGWVKEIKEFGPYKELTSSTRSFDEDPPPHYSTKSHNPYIEAFWKWWPELHRNLNFFRITGGEPLLSKDTFKILDYMIENPKPDLIVDVNSNFCVNDKIFNKFVEKSRKVAEKQKVGAFTSCEAYGDRANYIRPGLNYDKWLKNCRIYLQNVPESKLSFMCTFNILSASSFLDFVKDVLALKREFPMRVRIDIPVLMNPPYLQANILTKNFIDYITECVTFMYGNLDIPEWPPLCGTGFWEIEISKLIRIRDLMFSRMEDRGCTVSRKDFANFIDQHDERYNTNFLKVFPEYTDFYYYCKEIEL